MENFALKFNMLDSFSQGLVLDFIEMLLKRQPAEPVDNTLSDYATKYKKTKPQPFGEQPVEPSKIPFDHEVYRKQLLEMPAWSDEEIAEFDENIQAFKNWKIKEW